MERPERAVGQVVFDSDEGGVVGGIVGSILEGMK